MILANMITDRTIQAFSWMLIHSLWQGLLISVIGGLALMLTRRSSAVVRYNLVLLLFISFLLTVFCTLLYELNSFDIRTVQVTQVFSYAVNVRIFVRQLINYFSEQSFFIAMIWFIAFIGKSLSMTASMIYLRRARHYQIHAVSQYWNSKIIVLREKLQIERAVTLFESGYVKAPVVIGHLKPIILIPLGLIAGLPVAQIEAVLLHELAHIRRNDYAVNFMQNIAEAIFFFNPGLIWISSLIREEREHCCDDIAIAAINNKEEFVEALISFKEYSIPAPAYALAFAGQKSSLLNRVMRIVYQENKSFSHKEKGFFMAGVFVLMITCFGFVQVKDSEQVRKQLVKISRTIKTAVAEQLNTATFAAVLPPVPKKIEDDILLNEPGLVIPVKKVNRKLVKNWAASKNKWTKAWYISSNEWNSKWANIQDRWELAWDNNAREWNSAWAEHSTKWANKLNQASLNGVSAIEIEKLKSKEKSASDSLDLLFKAETNGMKTAYNLEMSQFYSDHHKEMDEMRQMQEKEIGKITGTFVPEKNMNTPTLKYKDRFADSVASIAENQKVEEHMKRYTILTTELDTIKKQQLDQFALRDELMEQWNDYLSNSPFVSRVYYWRILGIDTQYDIKADGFNRYFDKSWLIRQQFFDENPRKITEFDMNLTVLKDEYKEQRKELYKQYPLTRDFMITGEYFYKEFRMDSLFRRRSEELRALIDESLDTNDLFFRKITQIDLEIDWKKHERNDKTNQRNNEVVAENFRRKSDLEKLAIKLSEKAEKLNN